MRKVIDLQMKIGEVAIADIKFADYNGFGGADNLLKLLGH